MFFKYIAISDSRRIEGGSLSSNGYSDCVVGNAAKTGLNQCKNTLQAASLVRCLNNKTFLGLPWFFNEEPRGLRGFQL